MSLYSHLFFVGDSCFICDIYVYLLILVPNMIFILYYIMFVPFSSNTTGAKSGTISACTSEAPDFILWSWWGSCCSIEICVVFFIEHCLSFCPFFCWPLYCLSFDFRLQVTPLASSNMSYHKCIFHEVLRNNIETNIRFCHRKCHGHTLLLLLEKQNKFLVRFLLWLFYDRNPNQWCTW